MSAVSTPTAGDIDPPPTTPSAAPDVPFAPPAADGLSRLSRKKSAKEGVRVAVRVKPMITIDGNLSDATTCVRAEEGQVVVSGSRAFAFDHVFAPELHTAGVFDVTVKPLIEGFLDGYNSTVFAYGQTGSGKTHTMTGCTDLAIDLLFDNLCGPTPAGQDPLDVRLPSGVDVAVSMLELYNESPVDLLATAEGGTSATLVIREDPEKGVQVQGQQAWPCLSRRDLRECIEAGNQGRTTASTLMNATSSRSHLLLTITLKRRGVASKIHFADLAGSERIKKSIGNGPVTEGRVAGGSDFGSGAVSSAAERLKECIAINSGLLALGNVITALCDGTAHVPFRASKLTRILQDSLAGNSRTAMIACVSAAATNVEETISTLKYAYRAKSLSTKPIQVQDTGAALQAVVVQLRSELEAAHRMLRDNGLVPPPPDAAALPQSVVASVTAAAAAAPPPLAAAPQAPPASSQPPAQSPTTAQPTHRASKEPSAAGGKKAGAQSPGMPSLSFAASARAKEQQAQAAALQAQAAQHAAALQAAQEAAKEAQLESERARGLLEKEERHTKALERDLYNAELRVYEVTKTNHELQADIQDLQKAGADVEAAAGAAMESAADEDAAAGGEREEGEGEGERKSPQVRPATAMYSSVKPDRTDGAGTDTDDGPLDATITDDEDAEAKARRDNAEAAGRAALEQLRREAIEAGDAVEAASRAEARERTLEQQLREAIEDKESAIEGLQEACTAAEALAVEYEQRYYAATQEKERLTKDLDKAMHAIEASSEESARKDEQRRRYLAEYKERLDKVTRVMTDNERRLKEAQLEVRRKAQERARARQLQQEVQQLSKNLKLRQEAATREAATKMQRLEHRHQLELKAAQREMADARKEAQRLNTALQRKERQLQHAVTLAQRREAATDASHHHHGGVHHFQASMTHIPAATANRSTSVAATPAGRAASVGPAAPASPPPAKGSNGAAFMSHYMQHRRERMRSMSAAKVDALQSKLSELQAVEREIDETKAMRERAAATLDKVRKEAASGKVERSVRAWQLHQERLTTAIKKCTVPADLPGLEDKLRIATETLRRIRQDIPAAQAQEEQSLREADELLDTLYATRDYHVSMIRQLQRQGAQDPSPARAASPAAASFGGAPRPPVTPTKVTPTKMLGATSFHSDPSAPAVGGPPPLSLHQPGSSAPPPTPSIAVPVSPGVAQGHAQGYGQGHGQGQRDEEIAALRRQLGDMQQQLENKGTLVRTLQQTVTSMGAA